MDKEGQKDPNGGDVVFKTENIGDKATTEYFTNVKGEKSQKGKDKEKVSERRTLAARKRLFIIFGSLIGVILLIMLIFVVVSLINPQGKKYTREDFPENMDELEEKMYAVAFEDKDSLHFGESVDYLTQAIENTTDEDRKFELKTLRARMLYFAGYGYAATKEIERLEEEATTDQRKYQLYFQAAFVYFYTGDKSKAEKYQDKMNALDVPENHGEWVGDDGE